jgi:FKBP-type peptidyl-prolyl cis-trans isomerase SlyD
VQVSSKAVVTIDYTLKGDDGNVIDTSSGRKPLTYIHGLGNLVPGLEKALEGKGAGEKVEVVLPPEEGYGRRNEKLVRKLPLRKLDSKNPRPGERVRAQFDDGVRLAAITGVSGDYATVDGNHPLVDKTLHFTVEIVSIREATADELAHGHVHGPEGHNH